LVLSANYPRLPSFPESPSQPEYIEISQNLRENTKEKLALPVVPIRLPSPETFPLILGYLYTKDASSLKRVWNAPLPSSRVHPDQECEDALRQRRKIALARGIWQNCVVLGLMDEELVQVLHEAMNPHA
jgi:hypothetical protein